MRALSEEDAGYEALYRRQYPRIQRLCRLLLSDVQESEEVAQEVFLRTVRQYRSEKHPDRWDQWLTRVAVNLCHDRRRSVWWRWFRRSEQLGNQEFTNQDNQEIGQSPEQEIGNREQARRIWSHFIKLSPRQREIFVLRHVEGWSTDEVAEALGVSSGSIKRHLFRAVHQLRESIKGPS